jgi:surface protein
MFSGCSSLQSINLSSFNVTNVNDMNFMFSGCSFLKRENVKIGSYGKKILDELE